MDFWPKYFLDRQWWSWWESWQQIRQHKCKFFNLHFFWSCQIDFIIIIITVKPPVWLPIVFQLVIYGLENTENIRIYDLNSHIASPLSKFVPLKVVAQVSNVIPCSVWQSTPNPLLTDLMVPGIWQLRKFKFKLTHITPTWTMISMLIWPNHWFMNMWCDFMSPFLGL